MGVPQNEDISARERFLRTLEGEQVPGLVPTFEILFALTMELLRKVHPRNRMFDQWDQMSPTEQSLQIADAAGVYVGTARHFGHSAIVVFGLPGAPGSERMIAEYIRQETNDEFFLIKPGADSTLAIPDGTGLMDFCCRLVSEPDDVKREQVAALERKIREVEPLAGTGVFDGVILGSDYCFNSGPFMSPTMFADLVAPFLARLVQGYREMGFYVIKHTDGNVMPIIDQLVECRPHALHSLDPQAGVDLAVVKRQYGRSICLCGNVSCKTLHTGSDDDIAEAVRYALQHGMPGGGFVFSTSNSVYPGMPLHGYEVMMALWRREGCFSGEHELPA